MNRDINLIEEGVDTCSEEFKTWTKELLHDPNLDEVRITFTKADGTPRTLRCTTREDLIPSDKAPKGTGSTVTETTQRVFDLDLNEWRSFRWDSVYNISFTME